MTTKRKSKPTASNKNKVEAKPDKSRETRIAKAAVEPCWTAATVSTAFSRRTFGVVDLAATCAALNAQTKRVHEGDMRGVESTLVVQATALNSLFTDLARCAAGEEYLAQFEAHMKLALRAQNQCRMTLETLATIKNPRPVAFVKQANMGQNVQVNNDTRASENEKPPTELLEAPHAKPKWMDTGATRTPAPSHQEVEAMGTVDRAKNKGRQDKSEP